MSKWRCTCGHTIRDQTDNLSYKARFIVDQDQGQSFGVVEQLAEFVAARERGEQQQFLDRFFNAGYPRDLALVSIINDMISSIQGDLWRDMYECEQCGRLWIDYPQEKTMLAYQPEQALRGVLRTQREG